MTLPPNRLSWQPPRPAAICGVAPASAAPFAGIRASIRINVTEKKQSLRGQIPEVTLLSLEFDPNGPERAEFWNCGSLSSRLVSIAPGAVV